MEFKGGKGRGGKKWWPKVLCQNEGMKEREEVNDAREEWMVQLIGVTCERTQKGMERVKNHFFRESLMENPKTVSQS